MEAKEASQGATAIIIAMGMTTYPRELTAPAHALESLVWRGHSPTRHLPGIVAAFGHPHPLAALAMLPLEALQTPLPAPVLVNLLKHPLGTRQTRTIILAGLSGHYGRSFADRWEFVEYARKNQLPLDLASPWQPPSP
jgi:hypothetical protein